MQLYLAFARSTRPCKGLRGPSTLPRVRALDHASPHKGLRVTSKSCNFTSRSRARPRQSTQRVCASRLKIATLPRVRALDHASPRKGLRVTPKSCNFTSRSRARPRQSMQRVARGADKLQLYLAFVRSTTRIHAKVAFPIDGIGAGSGFRKKDRYTEM